MYSMVLMAAMLPSGDAAGFGKKSHGCSGGCSGTVVAGCSGYVPAGCSGDVAGCSGSCSGSSCHGGGFLGMRHRGGSSCCGGGGFLGKHKHKSAGCDGGCSGYVPAGCSGYVPAGCNGGGAVVPVAPVTPGLGAAPEAMPKK